MGLGKWGRTGSDELLPDFIDDLDVVERGQLRSVNTHYDVTRQQSTTLVGRRPCGNMGLGVGWWALTDSYPFWKIAYTNLELSQNI